MAGVILAEFEFSTFYIITIILLFIGLIMLLLGFIFRKHRISHIVLIIGWIIFGIYWLTQIPHFLYIGDLFNSMFCLLGFVLFCFFAYHEMLNYNWNESVFSLSYIAGITSVGGLLYYMIEKIEPMAKGLIYVVSSQSVVVYNLFGHDAYLGTYGYDSITNDLGLNIIKTPIGIVLACTGIQSIAIFVGILVATKSNRKVWVPWTKKYLKEGVPKEIKNSSTRIKLWKYKKARMKKVLNMTDRERFLRVFFYTIPIIYILNIFRNALIMHATVTEAFGPWEVTFDILHNYVSKVLSLVVLIIMVFLVFELLPECQEGIVGLLDLQYRNRRGMVKDGFVELKHLKKKKPESKGNKPETSEKKSKIQIRKKSNKNL